MIADLIQYDNFVVSIGVGIGIGIERPLRFDDAREQRALIDTDADTDPENSKTSGFSVACERRAREPLR